MPELTIRKITAQDRPDWDRMFTAYLTFYETSRPKELYDCSFARLLSGEDNEFKGLIALKDGQAIGFTHYLYHRHMWSVENTSYLQDLYVDPEIRGTGAGRALIEAVHDEATKAGASGVYWLTQDFNETARKLYDRVGQLTPFIRYNKPIG
ncbi:GNAT family N-acetyltransferase [Lentibacter sp. XHP0401]|uniref:GNAT family N-acetyltransferase n=1 Tax=Lentibacter sp. XHP0401 TaxID=2984334 RepID=UPI0021E9AB9B|nr:GNAT family N-acetyltransferase [Lentibacter sp. XHP0401]MCV2894175.1 GNAT family N-acetyltransferase [Lentibacter sp. XHP0401]